MNNVKFIYYNVETIEYSAFENAIVSMPNTVSHYSIKPGLLLVNYRGSSQDLYKTLGEVIAGKSILILDLDSGDTCYYGFMNKDIWTWLKENRN